MLLLVIVLVLDGFEQDYEHEQEHEVPGPGRPRPWLRGFKWRRFLRQFQRICGRMPQPLQALTLAGER